MATGSPSPTRPALSRHTHPLRWARCLPALRSAAPHSRQNGVSLAATARASPRSAWSLARSTFSVSTQGVSQYAVGALAFRSTRCSLRSLRLRLWQMLRKASAWLITPARVLATPILPPPCPTRCPQSRNAAPLGRLLLFAFSQAGAFANAPAGLIAQGVRFSPPPFALRAFFVKW